MNLNAANQVNVDIEQLLGTLGRIAQLADQLPDESTPAGKLTRQFLANNWQACDEGLLEKTSRIRIQPQPAPAPSIFRFEMDCAYKCKQGRDAPVELMPGPVRGTIYYRPDLFINRRDPPIAVQIDRQLAYFHPNCSRTHGFVCLGDLPRSPYPFPLDLLLEDHLFPILTYQNRRPAHPLDRDAAVYFALEPEAMEGLEPVEPLY